MTGFPALPHAPVSWGELLDKITILEIKREKLTRQAALDNVNKELSLLRALAAPVFAARAEIAPLLTRLKAINQTLWDLEERIRAKDDSGAHDAEFVTLARSIYKTNDGRAALKKEINLGLGSELIEEKNYKR